MILIYHNQSHFFNVFELLFKFNIKFNQEDRFESSNRVKISFPFFNLFTNELQNYKNHKYKIVKK